MHKDNGKEELRLTLSEITELMTYCKARYLHHCNFQLTYRNDYSFSEQNEKQFGFITVSGKQKNDHHNIRILIWSGFIER
jgi:hypothetical protein